MSESAKVAATRAMFGLWGRDSRRRAGEVARYAMAAARRVHRLTRAGEIALVTGASGSGKSTVLERLARVVREAGGVVVVAGWPSDSPQKCAWSDGDGARDQGSVCVGRARRRAGRLPHRIKRRVVDLFEGSLNETLRVLACAGLAEAHVFVSEVGALSQGERDRLRLALAMFEAQRCSRGCGLVTVIVDEFGSMLDRTTCASVAATVRRWVSGVRGVRVVAATAHEDVASLLSPDVVARQGVRSPAVVSRV